MYLKSAVVILVIQFSSLCISSPTFFQQSNGIIPRDQASDPAPPLPDLGDIVEAILRFGADIIDTLTDQDFQEGVGRAINGVQQGLGNTVEAVGEGVGGAVEAFQGHIERTVGAVQTVVPVAARVSGVAIDAAGQILSVKRMLIETIAKEGPRFVLAGVRLFMSLFRAAGDTAPILIGGVQQINELIPRFARFARLFTEYNARQAQKAAGTFQRSFSCQFNCADLKGMELRTCEQKHCGGQSSSQQV